MEMHLNIIHLREIQTSNPILVTVRAIQELNFIILNILQNRNLQKMIT